MEAKVEQSPWHAEGEEKRSTVQGMFSDIAPTYDLLNSIMSLRFHRRWRRQAVQTIEVQPGDCVLDVCCGTGDFLIPLEVAVGSSGQVIGVDFAEPMLRRAKLKTSSSLFLGDASALPFQSEQFNAVTIGWGLRNVPSIEIALQEIVRVMKPGARFACLDMSCPKGILGSISAKVFHVSVPLLGKLFGQSKAYAYLPKSTGKYITPERLLVQLTGMGLTSVRYKFFFFGNVCMHWGHKP